MSIQRDIRLIGSKIALLASVLLLLPGTSSAQLGKATSSGFASPTKVVLYRETVAEVHTNARFWPTDRIWRIVDKSAPEFLAEVGKVNEFPSEYLVSPDRRYLVINLERKLKILDLTTAKMQDLFESKGIITGLSYSPNGKQLFIWSLSKDPVKATYHYYAHLLTIENRKAELLADGDDSTPFNFVIGIWRSDGKILLKLPEGETYSSYHFDTVNKSLGKTPGDHSGGMVSESGLVMAVATHYVNDVCDEINGGSADSYDIIDPISGVTFDVVSSKGMEVWIEAISEDDKNVLYATRQIAPSAHACNPGKKVNYFRMKIGTHRPARLAQPPERMVNRHLRAPGVGAEMRFDNERHTSSVVVDNKVVVTSKNSLYLLEPERR